MSFETKDSGKRETFESGMVRDTQDHKTQYLLVFDGPMFERWAELLTRGAEKYEPRNWMKAEGEEELERFRASAVRHFYQWFRGDTDEDHAAAVVFNINGVEYVRGKMAEKVFDSIGEVFVDKQCSHGKIYWDSNLGYVCEDCGEAGVNRNRGAD